MPDTLTIQTKLYQKLALTERQFLENHSKNIEPNSKLLNIHLINDYKESLEVLRKNTEQLLVKGEAIEKIYFITTEKYKKLIGEIIEDAMTLLGPSPTDEYAFIAFGSLGRGFASPYSDLEFAIILKDDCHKEYFRVLSEFIHIRINALRECPISRFNVNFLSWITEEDGPAGRGLMLDPGNVLPHIPLSKNYELLGTPKQLASAFDAGSSLLDIVKISTLYNFTHLLGKQYLVHEYHREVNNILDSSKGIRAELTAKLLQDNVDSYHIHLGDWIKDGKSYTLKRAFYRPFTNLLDNLALQKGIHIISPWQIIDELYLRKAIDLKTCTELREALDCIGQYRLEAFATYQKQSYTIYPISEDDESDNSKKYHVDETKLLKIIKSIIHLQKLTIDTL